MKKSAIAIPLVILITLLGLKTPISASTKIYTADFGYCVLNTTNRAIPTISAFCNGYKVNNDNEIIINIKNDTGKTINKLQFSLANNKSSNFYYRSPINDKFYREEIVITGNIYPESNINTKVYFIPRQENLVEEDKLIVSAKNCEKGICETLDNIEILLKGSTLNLIKKYEESQRTSFIFIPQQPKNILSTL